MTMNNQHSSTSDSPDEEGSYNHFTPDAACEYITTFLSLSSEEVNMLKECLSSLCSDDELDPILVVERNPEWVALNGDAALDDVLDAIATFNMTGTNRRDTNNGRRWIFHFRVKEDLYNCQIVIKRDFPMAFALSGDARAAMVGGQSLASPVPAARTGIINKVGVRVDDVTPHDFFYL